MHDHADDGSHRPPLLLGVSRPAPGTLVVHVGGELDIWTAPLLEQYLADEAGDGAAELVLDLTGLTFLASSGCALLLRLADGQRAVDGRFVLVGAAQPAVVRVMELTGLDRVMASFRRIEDVLGRSRA
ncbi:MAG: STAS domain-containing protein [Pseudonocardia sp.]